MTESQQSRFSKSGLSDKWKAIFSHYLRPLLLGLQLALGLIFFAVLFGVIAIALTPSGVVQIPLLTLGLILFNSFAGTNLDVSVTGALLNLEPGPLFGSLGIHPTLLTLGLIIATYLLSKRQAKKLAQSTIYSLVGYAITVGIGFVSLAWVFSLFAASSVLIDGGTLTVLPNSLLTLVPSFLLVVIVSFAGFAAGCTSIFKKGLFAWAFRSTVAFFLSFISLLFTAAVIVSIILWIQPDFAESTPEIKIDSSLTNYLGLGVLGIMLFLPTILIFIFTLGVGGSLGISHNLGNANSEVWNALSEVLPQFDYSNIGALTLFGFPVEAALLGVVAIVSMTSAVIGHHQTGYVPTKFSHLLGFFTVAISLMISAYFLTNSSINWTNNGQSASTFTQGAVQLDEGSASAGIALGLIVIVFMLISAASFGATKHFRNFLTESYPRLFAVTSGKPVLQDKDRRASARFFGLETVVVLILLVAVPTSLVSVERIWASLDTPSALAAGFGSEIQKASIDSAKAMLAGDENYPWIPNKVLEIAKPVEGWNQESSAQNFNDKLWQVGDLDAEATLTWESNNGKVTYSIPTSYELDTYVGVIKHPTFQLKPEPIYLTFTNDVFYPADLMSKALLNEEQVQSGTYRAFPGQYHVVAEGYKLIAPTDMWVTSSGSELLISVGNEISFPSNSEEVFSIAADKRSASCNTVDSSGNSECFDADVVEENAKVTQGAKPSEFFSATNSEYTATGTKCDVNGKSWLLSAESVARKVTCTTTVEFLTSYFKSKYSYVQQPILKPVEILPCDVDEVCEPIFIDRIVGYQSSLQATQGEVFAQTRATSKVNYSFTLVGSLGADNKLFIQ